MFDIAWSEMLVIGAVALVVIGPKDLPKALRSVGEAVGKIRRMASEFQGQFNDAMREAELHDIKKQVEEVGGSVQAATKVDFNPIQTIRDELKGSAAAGAAGAGAATAAALEAPAPEPQIPLPDLPPPVSSADIAAELAPPPSEPVPPALAAAEGAKPSKTVNGADGSAA